MEKSLVEAAFLAKIQGRDRRRRQRPLSNERVAPPTPLPLRVLGQWGGRSGGTAGNAD